MLLRSACVAAVSLTRNAMHRRQNAAAVYRADSITSTTWTPLGNPTHNATSFSSQSTYILPVNGSYIYIADRFEPYIRDKVPPRYVWLPISNISRSSLTVDWRDEWSLPKHRRVDSVPASEHDRSSSPPPYKGSKPHIVMLL